MTTHPAVPPRDPKGRFVEYSLEESALDLDLDFEAVAREHEAPVDTATLSPCDVQARAHWRVWSSRLDDSERADAVRDAINAYVAESGKDALPPDEDARSYVHDGMADDDLLLDAAHEIGPLGHPMDRAFGAHVIGAVYDRARAARDERALAEAAERADDFLPPESEESRLAADRGVTVPQPSGPVN